MSIGEWGSSIETSNGMREMRKTSYIDAIYKKYASAKMRNKTYWPIDWVHTSTSSNGIIELPDFLLCVSIASCIVSVECTLYKYIYAVIFCVSHPKWNGMCRTVFARTRATQSIHTFAQHIYQLNFNGTLSRSTRAHRQYIVFALECLKRRHGSLRCGSKLRPNLLANTEKKKKKKRVAVGGIRTHLE